MDITICLSSVRSYFCKAAMTIRKYIRRRLLASLFIVTLIFTLNSLVFENLSKYCVLLRIPEENTVQRQFPAESGIYNKDDLVDSMIRLLRNSSFLTEKFWTIDYIATREALSCDLTGAEYLFTKGTIRSEKYTQSWVNFIQNINEHYLYDWNDENIEELLNDMATLQPRKVVQNKAGSELKFNFIFDKKFWTNVKPMRLLGFCRVPPTTGRYINLTQFRDTVPQEMRDFFFQSPAGNTCFYGKCDEHCSPKYAFCGQGDEMELSLMVYMPTYAGRPGAIRATINPYRQPYTRFEKPEWELQPNYCSKVQQEKPYNHHQVLLNLIDVHIFDFLIGNRDRHNIHHFTKFGEASNPILYDNGRGFGRSDHDYHSILTPLRQCCQIKKSTLLKLVKLYRGPEKLSDLLNASLQHDPVTPVLLPTHLRALDRRVVKILKAVAKCLLQENHPLYEVICNHI